MFLSRTLILILASLLVANGQVDPVLPNLPSAYSASLMWNIQMLDEHEISTGISFSVRETVDEDRQKSLIETEKEINYVNQNNETIFYLEYEKIIWKPGVHGVNRYLDIYDIQSGDKSGLFCQVDSHRDDSFVNFLFGYGMDQDDWYPSVSHMLHWGDKNYTYVRETVVNGISVAEYSGKWSVPEWKGTLDVTYYWSDPGRWDSTAGVNRSAPVAIETTGSVVIDDKSVFLNMTVEFSDFSEWSGPESWFNPPVDLWCEGRTMDDELHLHTDHFTFESELVFSFKDEAGVMVNLISPRTEWYDERMRVSRADYKPPDLSHASPDPFDNPNGFITQIQDYNTGIMYSISQEFGNCSIERIDESHDGQEHGHIHMMNPFYTFFSGDKFAFNGVTNQRGFGTDVFIRSAPLHDYSSSSEPNYTTVLLMTSPDWDIENGDGLERMIPAKIIRYPTDKYNVPGYTMVTNYYNFRESRDDFQDYDITPCFEDNNKMHLMMRLGWDPEMDIDHTLRNFYVQTRLSVVIWGQVTPIRVQNIEADVDPDNKALFVIFTLVGNPPGFAPINNELTDAYRSLDDIYSNIEEAIEKGFFKIDISTKHGGMIAAVAEAGSLTELGSRGGSYTYKDGYSPGAMAACGLSLLFLTILGVGALLIFVLKI